VSRLDCCISLLCGISHSLIRKVRFIQNAAVRLLTETRCGDHISPVLRHLHWLQSRDELTSSWRALSSRLCLARYAETTYTWSQQAIDVGCVGLSTDRALFRTHNTFGDGSFAAAEPRVWNSLSQHSYATKTSHAELLDVNLKCTGFSVFDRSAVFLIALYRCCY